METTIGLHDDYLDSRDIQKRIDELKDEEELDEEDTEELKAWETLKAETEEYGWEDGIFFFHENVAEEYAQQFAEDTGAISSDAHWPAYCIDWEWAARDFLMDYTSCEIDGQTYYYQEA